MKVTLSKKSAGMKAGPTTKAKVGDPAPPAINIQDNQDNTYSVSGVDAAGASVDISGVATLTAVSADPTILTAGLVTGMTGSFSGIKPGTTKLTLTATWNDGSIGPFVIDVPATVSGGPAVGITVVLGTPTVRP